MFNEENYFKKLKKKALKAKEKLEYQLDENKNDKSDLVISPV